MSGGSRHSLDPAASGGGAETTKQSSAIQHQARRVERASAQPARRMRRDESWGTSRTTAKTLKAEQVRDGAEDGDEVERDEDEDEDEDEEEEEERKREEEEEEEADDEKAMQARVEESRESACWYVRYGYKGRNRGLYVTIHGDTDAYGPVSFTSRSTALLASTATHVTRSGIEQACMYQGNRCRKWNVCGSSTCRARCAFVVYFLASFNRLLENNNVKW